MMPRWTFVYLGNSSCLVQLEVRLTGKGRRSWSWRVWSGSDGGCPRCQDKDFILEEMEEGKTEGREAIEWNMEVVYIIEGESLQ